MSLPLLILGLFLFVALVVVHELGHFIAARRNGVEVEEFGIGFPPRLFGRNFKNNQTPWSVVWQGILGFISFGGWDKKLTKDDVPDNKKTIYTINLLPLGGFVKLKGEHDADTAKGTYGSASLPAKVKIMLAGVGMNLFTAFAILTLLAIVGMPKLLDNQFSVASDATTIQRHIFIGYIEPGSPAEKAGLQLRDDLASIGLPDQGQHTIISSESFPDTTKQYAGQEVELQYRRDGELKNVKLQLRPADEVEASRATDSPKGYLGVSPVEYELERYTWSAPIVAVGIIKQLTVTTFAGLGSALKDLVTGNTAGASEQVSGPVGIFVILRDGTVLGYRFVLMIIAVISLTLAIMNVLPIPALDGGRLFVTLLYRGMRKPLKPKVEDLIHGSGFAALMMLIVLITIVDVKRFF